MPYDEMMVAPMRAELSRIGVQELRSAEEVEQFMGETSGTALIVINSVCGCAAGTARPGVTLALQNEARPDRVATVFAGQDVDATAKARSYFADFPPSSPCFALFKDGEIVDFVPRHQIENKDARAVGTGLVESFNEHCK